MNHEIELLEFIKEMKDLSEERVLRNESDYRLWLEDVRSECIYCFDKLEEFVNQLIQFIQ